MTTDSLIQRLEDLKAKQKKIDAAWRNTGDKPLLDFFVEIIPKTLNCERCSIFVLDPQSDNIWVQSGTGLKEHQVAVPRDESLVGQVISSGEAQLESDMENRVGSHEWVDMQTGYMTQSALCVPVRGAAAGQVNGAIQVLNKRGMKTFSDEDQKILERLAFHIQMNIENIYLHQQLAKLLNDTRKTISALEKRIAQLEKS
jgi:GAF domain-containing protein